MIQKFFKFVFRSLYAFFAFIGFGVLSLTLIFSITMTYLGRGPLTTPPLPLSENSILTLNLNGTYEEHNVSSGILGLLSSEDSSLYNITQAIRTAAHDPKIKGIVAKIDQPTLGTAQIQELRDAVLEFRKSGKPSWCFTETFGEQTQGTGLYYLATAFEEIWLQPLGALNLTGVKMEVPFGKEALDKIDVKAEIVQKKEYKSYAEMFTREDFSEANREASKAVLDSILSQVVEGIAKERKLPHDQIQLLIAEGPYYADEAITLKLVDRLDYRQNLINLIHEKLGEDIKFASIATYINTLPKRVHGPKVALIFGSGLILNTGGEILSGSGMGSDDTYKTFNIIAKDPDVKAIVFRINSEGGSPSASEAIYNIINYIKDRYKIPVIVSMSDVAASGGYWISIAGTKIVAQPATLTGSIGAFAGKFVLSGLFEKLGIKWGELSTSENARMWSLNESYTPAQWVKLNAYLDKIYDGFTSRVAKERKLSLDQVEKVARGRVWTGEQALALGLVDQLGNLQTAIDLARKEAGLEQNVGVQVFPREKLFIEKFATILDSTEEGYSHNLSVLEKISFFFNKVMTIIALMEPQNHSVYAPLGKIQ